MGVDYSSVKLGDRDEGHWGSRYVFWDLVVGICSDILSEEDKNGPYTAEGYLITKEKAKRISDRMKASLSLTCPLMNKQHCGFYDEIKSFIEFCENSGGFYVS